MEKEFAMIPQEAGITLFWILSGKFNDFDFLATDEEGNEIKAIVRANKSKGKKIVYLIKQNEKWVKLYVSRFEKRIIAYGKVLNTNNLIIIHKTKANGFKIREVQNGWLFYNISFITYNK